MELHPSRDFWCAPTQTQGKVVVILSPVSKNKKGKGKGKVIHNSEPRIFKQAGHHLWQNGSVCSNHNWDSLRTPVLKTRILEEIGRRNPCLFGRVVFLAFSKKEKKIREWSY